MIIDAKNMIVGRIATVAAKGALLGENVEIVNCEEAFITANKSYLVKEIKRKRERGTFKGPFIPRKPDRFVRRIIRGMLPHKQEKGRNAYKRIMCYIGLPKKLEGQETIKIDNALISKVKNLNYMSIGQICRKLGDKDE